ncbi:MAG: DEAD/DEAH box helicase family protein [Candidatus Brocadiaceae bacterium]|nr:DEAD/DEAH box helicase family protein [Candidatus Brocadiaceae bacterium]
MKTTKWLARDFIIPGAIASIRDAIERSGENEVFLIGKLNEELLVTDIDICAAGNRHAVPAALNGIKYGDVIIHNHPDGNLTPSEADLEIASHMGSLGVGCYIIDNRVEHVYPVVKAQKMQEYERLNFNELSAQFLPDGNLAQHVSNYEYRSSQMDMLKSVTQSFNDDKIAVIEAGTGTGKSLAYLLPAIYWSMENRERVVVSTHTINLQEQLIEKDIPMLKKGCKFHFKSVLVKGRNNYLCLRKVHNLQYDGGTLVDDTMKLRLYDLLAWAAKTRDGSKADLNFIPHNDAWDAIQSEADQCTRLKCHFYDRCFFYRARRNAASADILVVNHYLMMVDLIVRKETKGYDAIAILPPFKKIIIDEAHHLEAVATANLGHTVSRLRLLKQLGKLINVKDNRKGLLPYLKTKLKGVTSDHDKSLALEIMEIINTKAPEARQSLYDAAQGIFDEISDAIMNYIVEKTLHSEREIKLRITPDFLSTQLWQDVVEPGLKGLSSEVRKFTLFLKSLLDEIGSLSKKSQDILSSVLIDVASCKVHLKVFADDLSSFTAADERYCRWIEFSKYKQNPVVRFSTAPLSVANDLKACLYDNYDTIVLTSATLAIGKTFSFFKKTVGLNLLAEERLCELISGSPFNYKKQSMLGIPTDICEPDTPGYAAALEENIFKAIEISMGRALILFTSYKLLDQIFHNLEHRVARMGYTCLKQGTNNRHALLESFKKDISSVLFATDSFWEGIDVKGESLQCVILTRLPFRVPTEPILEARAEAIESAGGNAFYDFSLPTAVIKLKQGFGRLIRSSHDRGMVVIFDRRVVTKNYGYVFLQSLPDMRCIKDKGEIVFREMRSFIGG